MMMKEDIVKQIIKDVGGSENINNAWHCMTRLRFDLKDEKKVDYTALEKIPKVVGTKYQSNQLQVVIGTDVADYYAPLAKELGLDEKSQESSEKKGAVSLFMDTVSGVFGPIVPAIAGAGMIKALLVVLTTYHFMSADGSTYKILSAAGNSVFFFLPLFLAFSAARVFRTNQFISLAIVAALLEPNFTALVTENGVTVDFLGIPAILIGYSGTVIPAIISIYLYSKLETLLKRMIPKSLEIFLLPMVALLIMVPLTVLVVGPIGVTLGDGIGSAMNFISDRSGLLAGLIIGAGWTFLVMIGIHWGVVPIMINNLAVYGYDVIRPMVAAATFASAGVALGVFLRSKDKNV